MKRAILVICGLVLGLLSPFLVVRWTAQADVRLQAAEAEAKEGPQVAVAAEANEQYCTPRLQKILRRVLTSCGLIQGAAGRGCEPVDAKSVATMSGEDFNALFLPMKERGSIVQFEQSGIDRSSQMSGGAKSRFSVVVQNPHGPAQDFSVRSRPLLPFCLRVSAKSSSRRFALS